ncbi:MAG: hypothetical protein ABSG44_14440 [Thermodesulfobacteriota bacterium]
MKREDPYQGKVIVLQKGFYLLGVLGFEKEEDGENRLADLREKSNEKPDSRSIKGILFYFDLEPAFFSPFSKG